MRFSFWPNPSQSFNDVIALSRHVEQTGWDGVWYADHFMPNAPDTSTPWPEAWMTLAAIGALVPRIRIGTLVAGNTYRHPAVLAKMAATLDHITGGRVVLGLGAGWQENEHQQYGIPFYTTGERLARLDEACQVIKRLYSRTEVEVRRQVLPTRRRVARTETGAEDAAAADRRRRRKGHAADHRAIRRRMERVGHGRHAEIEDGNPRWPLQEIRPRSEVDSAQRGGAVVHERRSGLREEDARAKIPQATIIGTSTKCATSSRSTKRSASMN